MRLLHFFKADPEHFDLVFVANATAAIKLVVDCIVDYSLSQPVRKFWYGYHKDSHTSLVGPREVATSNTCFTSDKQVEDWLNGSIYVANRESIGLFGFPGQSNLTGNRLPLNWSGRIRRSSDRNHDNVYSLLDAASLASTTQIDLSDHLAAPDFTAISLYKIFGFPDLGALIVRKASGHFLARRRYFGGGTVDMVINGSTSTSWSSLKENFHERLEDGTPPFHSIIALDFALTIHERLYGSMTNVSIYTCNLSKVLFDAMSALRHGNGRPLCTIYAADPALYGDPKRQGPIISFNLKDSAGKWIGKSDVEKLAVVNGIQLRSGGVCNPGGIAASLDLNPQELRDNFAEGVRCGNDIDVLNGKPTGIVRVSLGAMSNMRDVRTFLTFLLTFIDDSHKTRILPVRMSQIASCTRCIRS